MLSQCATCRFSWLIPVLVFAGMSPGLFGQLLYVGNGGDDTISSYVIDQETGLLTELLPRVASTGGPSSVTIHPSGKFLYVTNSGNANLNVNNPSLASFSIDPTTGALTPINSLALPPGTGPQGAAIDPAGKFLFFANSGPGNVSVYSIDAATGALTAVPGSPFTTPANPNNVVVHPGGKFAYVSANGAGQVAAFSIGATGALTPVAGSPFAARNNLIWMTMDPAGKFLYVAERQDNGILGYAVDANTGALTPIAGSPYPATGGVTGLTVDRAGRFLYAAMVGTGGVTMYTIGAVGALSQPRGTGAILGAFAPILDPSGKYMYVTGQQSGGLAALAVDAANGTLSPLPQQFYNTGPNPTRGATIQLTPPVVPPIIANSAFNQFSGTPPGMPYYGVAQGSRMSISGTNIGPAAQMNASLPLTNELGGVSMRIQSGDVTTQALMAFVSNGFVTGVIPSTTPLGDATVTITYKGRTTAPLPITIVPTAPGIATQGDGNAPARGALNSADPANPEAAFADPTNVNALHQSARPGQIMILHVTGLGPVDADETQSFLLETDAPVDVIVGYKSASAIATYRTEGGQDYILFKLPEDTPEGCYVPIAVRSGGMVSNVSSISVAAGGGTCSEPTFLSSSDIDAARRAGQLTMGSIVVDHLDLSALGLDNEAGALFGRVDYNSLLNSISPAGAQLGIRQSFGYPTLGTCTVTPGAAGRQFLDLPSKPVTTQVLSAGQSLNLSGPQATVQLSQAPFYQFNSDEDVFTPGSYTVDNGAGLQPIGPFKASLTMPPPIAWTNRDALITVDRSQDLTVTWTGGVADKEYAIIAGVAQNHQAIAGFLCAEKVSAGKFTVPAWVLSSLPNSDLFPQGDSPVPGGFLGIGTAPLTSAGRFTGPGLDLGIFSYEQATVNFVLYQ